MKCKMCGKEEMSLLRANHSDLGTLKICMNCWANEKRKHKLLPLDGNGGCCR